MIEMAVVPLDAAVVLQDSSLLFVNVQPKNLNIKKTF